MVYSTSAEVLTTVPTKVAHIIFTTATSNDTLELKDRVQSGTVVKVGHHTSKDTYHLDFSITPIFFPNGIEISSISSNCSVTIVTTQGGSD